MGLGVCPFALEPAITNSASISAFSVTLRLIDIECAPRNISLLALRILAFEHTKSAMVKFLVRYRMKRGFKKLGAGEIVLAKQSC